VFFAGLSNRSATENGTDARGVIACGFPSGEHGPVAKAVMYCVIIPCGILRLVVIRKFSGS